MPAVVSADAHSPKAPAGAALAEVLKRQRPLATTSGRNLFGKLTLPTQLLPHLHLQVSTSGGKNMAGSGRHFKPKPSAYIESCFIPVRLVSTVVGGAI